MTSLRSAGLALAAALLASACQSTVRSGAEISMGDLATEPPLTVVAGEVLDDPAAPGTATDASDLPGAGSEPAGSGATKAPEGPGVAPTAPSGNEPGEPPAPSAAPTSDANEPEQPQVAEPAPPGGQQPENDFAELEMGRGVTEDEIVLGVHASSDLTAAFSALGANANAVDESQASRALIDWFNERGGIAGRQLRGVFHETNPASGTFAAQAQAACATFTEDNQVFAVMSSAVGGDDSMLACLGQSGTPLIEGNLWLFDQQYYDQNPGRLYQPARMVGDRWVRAYVDGLEEIGYLDEGAGGLGLMRFDHPVFQRMSDDVFKPRLAEHGHELVDEVVIQSPKGVPDFAGMAGELNSAVLRLKANGVTHLMFLENNGIMAFFFFDQAESQGFRPRYGLNSMDILATMAKNADPKQLENAVGVSFYPSSDLFDEQYLGGNPQWERCRQIMTEAGLQTVGYYVQPRCDAFFFLQAALERAPALTVDGLRAGVEALGTSFVSGVAAEGRTRFGPGDHDGVNSWVPLAYDLACECFRHTGPVRALP